MKHPYSYAEALINKFEALARDWYIITGKRPRKVRMSRVTWDIITSYYREISHTIVPNDPNTKGVSMLMGVEVVVVDDFKVLE